MEFCTCGSIKIDGKCTNHKPNCPFGTGKRKVADFKTPGFAREKKTGVIIDKETGTRVLAGRGKDGKVSR